MTSPLPSITPTEPRGGTRDLGWLLVNFLEEVPGVQAAVLGTLDGLSQASAGLAAPQPDHLAAVATTLHSSAKSGGNLTDPPGGDVELVMGQLAGGFLFVMATQQSQDVTRPPDAPVAGVAGTLLTVLAARDADTRMIGKEMAKLIHSVAAHLRATTRSRGNTMAGTSAGAGAAAGAGDEG